MTDILFPLSSSPGASPSETAGRLINAFSEKLGDSAKAPYVRRRAPGLRTLDDTGVIGARGFHYFNDEDLFVAQLDRLLKVNKVGPAYTFTDLGSLPGSGLVTIAHNNKAPVADIIAVTENGAFLLTSSGPPMSLADADLPQPNSVCFIDGYFMFTIRDGRMFASAINDTTVNALDFAKAESHPGGLLRGVAFGEQYLVFGPSGGEVWQNTGNPTGFPFSRVSVISTGLASAQAITGFEDGFASTVIFVGNDNCVYSLSGGYVPTPISTPDVERSIEATADKSAIDAMVFVIAGHMFVAINGPGFSWVYDLKTGFWHERQSYLGKPWRAIRSIKAFDQWIVGDRETGKVFGVDARYPREDVEPLIFEVRSTPAAAFPNRVSIPRVDFNFVPGTGMAPGEQPIETLPQAIISWADDGGYTWSTPVQRDIGPQGQFGTRASVNRTGTTGPYGRQWRVQVSDPVYAAILGGSFDAIQRSR